MTKKIFSLIVIIYIFLFQTGCGIGKQTQQLKAFEHCDFKFIELNSLIVAGQNITPAFQGEAINLGQLSGLALGFLTKEIPMQGLFTIEVKNNGSKVAALNQFDYEIYVQDKMFTTGVFDQTISIQPGQTQQIRVPLDAEIYQFLKQDGMLNHLQSFVTGIGSGPEKILNIQFKIKPSLKIGQEYIKYPGFITLQKQIKNIDIK